MSENNSNKSVQMKIVIIGEPMVGKTSLRRRFLGEKFENNYIETLGADFSYREFSYQSYLLKVSIWDLAGQEEYLRIQPQYFYGARGALLVYDMNDEKTIERLPYWMEKFVDLTDGSGNSVIILGNKSDLVQHASAKFEKQKIKIQQMIANFSKEITIDYMMTSALDGVNVNNAFEGLVINCLNYQNLIMKSLSGDSILDKSIPAAYVLTMHETIGPLILAKDPPLEGTEVYSDSEALNSIKYTSMLDFNDVAYKKYINNSFSWSKPDGTFQSIAFTIDRADSRGGKSLFIIGYIESREVKHKLDESRPLTIGYLHQAMNVFVSFENKLPINLVSVTEKMDERIKSYREELSEILNDLRIKINSIIQ
jgi:small GTP-binding protein